MATVGHANTRSCKNDATAPFSADDNTSASQFAAALSTDNSGVAYPDLKPSVQKPAAVDLVIYGKFMNLDQGSGDVTVATGGIQSFTKSSTGATDDIGRSIISTTTAGLVDTSETAGIGMVIGYNGTTLFVDLDKTARPTA